MNKDFIEQLSIWHEEDRYQEIIDALESLQIEKLDYDLIGQLARAYNNRGEEGDYDRAANLLLSIAEQGKNDAIWHFRLGFSYYCLHREEEALIQFERVLELNPEDDNAKVFRMKCLNILDSACEEFNPQLYTELEIDCLEAHVKEFFGNYESVFHEIASPDIHVDILILPPTDEKNYYTLITQGMGAHLMNVPAELAEYKLERAEVLISLPADWDLENSSEMWYWPLRWLKILARLPGEHDTWLGWGHTVPNGGSFAENTKLSGVMLVTPDNFKEGSACCIMPDGSEINFYQVLPLYEEEMEYKIKNGAEALLEKMADVSHVVNVYRDNTCVNPKDVILH